MGVIYRAEHESTRRVVALKLPHPGKLESFMGVRAEVSALRRLSHPGIVELLDAGEERGLPWYAMELLEGRTVAELADELWAGTARSRFAADAVTAPTPASDTTNRSAVTPTPPPLAGVSERRAIPLGVGGGLTDLLSIFSGISGALGYLHAAGLRHGDLKPANVFLTKTGRSILLDFGLAGRNQGALGRESLERAAVGGTLAYLAPEQLRGEPTDGRADLYALGVLMFEVLTGRLPFPADKLSDLLVQQLAFVPPRVGDLVAGVSSLLDDLVARLLAVDPRDRFAYADDVSAVLMEVGAPRPAGHERNAATVAYLCRANLCGRDEVLAQLDAASARMLQGRGERWLLAGESGAGKTSLVAEIGRRAARLGANVLLGECPPAGSVVGGSDTPAAPLTAFRDVLRHVADVCQARGAGTTERLLGTRLGLLARFEPALSSVPGAERCAEQPDLPAPSARRRLVREMALLLSALAAETPLLLVLDDLQWADPLSLAVLDALPDEGLAGWPLLVVGTYRGEEALPELKHMRASSSTHHVDISRLDEASMVRMVGEMLGTTQPPAAIVAAVARHSEGNPLFAAEYLRTVVAEGVLVRAGGRWALGSRGGGESPDIDALALPRTVDEIVGRRLDALAAEDREVIQRAAVAGRDFDLGMLVVLTGQDELALRARLREAVLSGVLEETGREAGRFRFAHDTFREGAYRRLPKDQLVGLHRAAAELLDRRCRTDGSAAERLFPDLIRHWKLAVEPFRAVDWMERAAEAALAGSAHKTACTYFEQAKALVSSAGLTLPVERLALWERRWGDALQGLGDIAGSRVHLEAALALLGTPVPETPAALGLGLAQQLARQVAHRLSNADAASGNQSSPLLLEGARAHEALLQAYYYAGDDVRMLYSTLGCLNMAETFGSSPELAIACSNAHAVAGLLCLRELAESFLERAYSTLAETPSRVHETYVWMQEGHYRAGLGGFDVAHELFRRVVTAAKEIGYVRREEEGSVLAAATLAMQGRFDDALVIYDGLFRSALRGDVQTQCWALMGRANVLLAQDRCEEALIEVRQAEPLSRTLGRHDRLWVSALLGACALRVGDMEAASAHAAQAMAEMGKGPPAMPSWIDPYCHVADVYLTQLARSNGSLATTRLATRACRYVRRVAAIFPALAGRASVYEGKLAWLRGNTERGSRLWARVADDVRATELDRALADLYGALSSSTWDYERETRLNSARQRLRLGGAKHFLVAAAAEELPAAFF
jgi:tetratricopeptide (TPR) repeat protein